MKDAAQAGRDVQLREVAVFLFLIVPSMVLSFFVVRQGMLDFVITAYATMLRDVGLVALIAFFVWRNQETFGVIGWRLKNCWNEIGVGAVCFVFLSFSAGLIDRLLQSIGVPGPSTPLPKFLSAGDPWQFLLASFLVVAVAIAEETMFRGYLILRLTAVTKSEAMAVVLSSVIFSLGHGYEGAAGVVTVGFMGFVFALVYVWRRSLVAPITMHFLQDFIGIVLLPLLGHK